MKGLGPMIIAGASLTAILACQGCMQTDAYFYPSADPAPVRHSVQQLVPKPSASVSSDVTAVIGYHTSQPRTPFEVIQIEPDTRLTQPLSLNFSNSLNSGRLYSSDILTSFASDREQNNLSPVPQEQRLVEAELELSAPADFGGLQLDVGIAPRLSIGRSGPVETQRFGGELRIGQNFDKRGQLEPVTGWYLFAGADGEALVWEPDDTGNISINSMALRDRVTVGDMQAGVSFQRGYGQLSLSYIRREVEYRERNLGASENEDFAGVSFTFRH